MSLAVDTNLFVYVQDGRDPEKQRIASDLYHRLAERDDVFVGLQVMGELFAVLVRKLKQEPATAREAVESLGDAFETFGYDAVDVHAALAAASDGVLSYWDALLLSAASRVGCTVLVSEDMQDGFRFGTITVVSPFADGGPSPTLERMLSTGAPG